MFKNIRKTLATLLSVATLVAVPIGVPALALAAPNINEGLCTGANLQVDNTASSSCSASTGDATDKVNNLITTVINVFSIIVGVVAVIMIIVGGLRYITSSGESSNVSAAKNTIIYAIIGLIVVALAQFVVKFVLGKVTQ